MKKIILLLLLFSLQIIPSSLYAGAHRYEHKTCGFPFGHIAKVTAKIINAGTNQIVPPCKAIFCPATENVSYPHTIKCGANNSFNGHTGLYYWTNYSGRKRGYAGSRLRISQSLTFDDKEAYSMAQGWSVICGDDYFAPLPLVAPLDSAGMCGSWSGNINVVYDSINHQVLLQNISGGVMSTSPNYTGVYYILVYAGYSPVNDSGQFLQSQIINSSYLKIENGNVAVGGTFLLSDLSISSIMQYDSIVGDSLPGTVAEFSSGINKIISVPANISLDSIGVFFLSENGYGQFMESKLILPNNNNIPTLSQWGLIILSMALVTAGVWYIRKRRILTT